MAEFLCDTMPDRNYDDPDDDYGYGFGDRDWGDIPQRAYSRCTGTAENYVIPIPSRDGPLTLREQERIEDIGVQLLANEIYIRIPLVYTSSELRALLETHDYVRGNIEPWWGMRRHVG